MRKKVGIYTPYLESFGGGERYMLTIAQTLSSDHEVDLFLDRHLASLGPKKLISDLGVHLNLDLSKVNLINAPVGQGSSFFSRLFFLKKYDLLIYLTDGSIFYSTAKKNLIHFQVPFKNGVNQNPWGKLKLSSWDLAICNSEFTRGFIEKTWPIKCVVLYPPVAIEDIKPLKKEKQILTVGRFNSFLRSKRHDLLISAFVDLLKDKKLNGWSLHLAGSVEGDKDYLGELKKKAEGLPVFFYPNLPFKQLVRLYGQSSIYWHAAGFGETDPAKMEHFGITTVEAMAGGCVPIVIGKGGQTEIVEDGFNGLLWDSLDDLKNLTLKVAGDEKLAGKLSEGALLKSKIFSRQNFEVNIRQIISSL